MNRFWRPFISTRATRLPAGLPSQPWSLTLVQIFRGGSSVENPKSRLQEMVQGIGLPTPRYQQISVEGP